MANDLIKSNLDFYDRIKPRSHHNNSTYTVLSSINDARTGELLALATGTQASFKLYPNDIEDCHAESLVRRAFKRFIIDKLLCAADLIEEIKHLNSSCYIVFISQFPCGLLKRYQGEEQVHDRKPGRGQRRDGGELVHVRRSSCLNKLARWISSCAGFQGDRLAKGLGVKTNLIELLIGDCEPEASVDYDQMTAKLVELLDLSKRQVGCRRVAMRRDDLIFDSTKCKQPQAVALVWWLSGSSGRSELVVDGRKMGLTRKQSESESDNFKLKISDYWLRKDTGELIARLKEVTQAAEARAANLPAE